MHIVTRSLALRQNNQIYLEIYIFMEVEVSATEENRWTKDGNTTIYRKSIPLDSQLGQRVLNETAIRYPQFKPKYIDQIRECPDAPYDMVAATIIGPEGLVVSILDENGIPRPEEFHKDIASVTYILSGNVLNFFKMYTFYDFVTMNEPPIRPELREFYENYQQIKQDFPEIVYLIEYFARIYEKQIVEYHGINEPLALRELMWNFALALIKASSGQKA